MREVAQNVVRRIAQSSPSLVKRVKSLLTGHEGKSMEERLAADFEVSMWSFESEIAMEGITAFLEKCIPGSRISWREAKCGTLKTWWSPSPVLFGKALLFW